MYQKKPAEECIELLEAYELAIAALYDAFATTLPLHATIWTSYADEERQHAAWMKKLHAYVLDGRLPLEQTRITAQAAQTAISFIEKQRNMVLRQPVSLAACLNIAINVENTLLESAFFKVFKLTAPAAQEIRTKLQAATKAHLDGLLEWRQRNRAG